MQRCIGLLQMDYGLRVFVGNQHVRWTQGGNAVLALTVGS